MAFVEQDDYAGGVTDNTSPPLPSGLKTLVVVRVGFLALVLGGVYWMAQRAGVLDQASPEGIRDLVAQWGTLSVLVYLLAFALGQLVYVPGMLFVVAGSMAFGGFKGFLLAMVGSVLSITVSFYVARLLGGTPLADPKQAWLKRMIWRLDAKPVSSILILRLIVGTAPWLNYLLGMSAVTLRDYLWGSVLGMALPVLLTVVFTDWLLQFFS